MIRPLPIALLAIAIVGVLVAAVTTALIDGGDAPPDVAEEPEEPATPTASPAPTPVATPTPTPTPGPIAEEPTPRPEPELDEPGPTSEAESEEAGRDPRQDIARQPRTEPLPSTGGASGLIAVGLLGGALTLGAARLTVGGAARRGR